MRILKFFIISFITSIIIIACNYDSSNQKIDNLVAFSKLYGYVRYFHPSDLAANTDWDDFVVKGVDKVKNARDNEELSKILKQLFYPIAPTIQIYNENEKPVLPNIPKDTTGLTKVFWQHYGLEDNDQSNIYKSIRTNRIIENSNNSFLCYNELNDNEFQHCKIQFDLKLNTEFLNKESYFVIGLKGKNFQDEKTDTVFANGNNIASVKLTLENQASPLYVGFEFVGQGKVIVDDAKLTIQKGNIVKSFPIPNAGFEEYNNESKPKNWEFFGKFYDYKPNKTNPISGKTSFEISSMNNYYKGAIFDIYPKENEFFDKELIDGLKCRIPLVLWSDSSHTIEIKSDNYKILEDITKISETTSESNLDNINTCLADVIITWNVIQHFFPYFEYVEVDWAEQQKKSLKLALKEGNPEKIKQILENMLEPLKDGHISVFYNQTDESGVLPFLAEWIENKAVITKSAITPFKSGDIIMKIKGKTIIDFLSEQGKYIPGSPQLKMAKCLNWGGLWVGNNGDDVNITIKRDGKMLNFNFNLMALETIRNLRKDNLEPIREFKNGIYYINIGTVNMEDFEMYLDKIKNANGLIIDLREYPGNDIFGLISYLTDSIINSPSWYIPKIIYPDRKNLKFEFSNWQIHPKQPFLKCKKIFIFDSGVISAGETLSSLVKYNKLGITIGQPTAGTNGNINTFKIPGNVTTIFTGMKVLNADNSQHYIKGVQPDIFVNKTIKGVKEGRDEYIDKAIELLMKK